MYYRISVILLALFGIASCTTDFQLTTGGKEMPVIYSILSVDEEYHYVRVERLFVDENVGPLELAEDSTEVFYDEVSVSLKKGNTTYALEKVDASEIGLPRDSGLFLTEPNFVYRISDANLDLNASDLVEVEVVLPDDTTFARAMASIVGKSELDRPSPNDRDFKFPLAPKGSYLIQWDGDEDASFYDIYIVIHLREIRNGEITPLVLEWPVVLAWENDQYTIEGTSFFNFLRSNLTEDPQIARRLDSIDLRIDAGGEALERFIEINNLNTGITSSQVIPNYTNVENGLGLFSSSSSVIYTGYQLSPNTVDSLSNSPIVEALNFE